MEYESGDSSLTYRYTYGLQKDSAVVYGIFTEFDFPKYPTE